MEQLKARKYGDCGKTIPFQTFLRDNPTISMERAEDLWKDPFIIPYCPKCFLNRPENLTNGVEDIIIIPVNQF